MNTKELGKAGIIIELEDSRIKVFHQETQTLLYETEVTLGAWDYLWSCIKSMR